MWKWLKEFNIFYSQVLILFYLSSLSIRPFKPSKWYLTTISKKIGRLLEYVSSIEKVSLYTMIVCYVWNINLYYLEKVIQFLNECFVVHTVYFWTTEWKLYNKPIKTQNKYIFVTLTKGNCMFWRHGWFCTELVKNVAQVFSSNHKA